MRAHLPTGSCVAPRQNENIAFVKYARSACHAHVKMNFAILPAGHSNDGMRKRLLIRIDRAGSKWKDEVSCPHAIDVLVLNRSLFRTNRFQNGSKNECFVEFARAA